MHLPHAFEAISLSLTSTASLRLQRFRFPHTTARNPHTTPPTTSYCSPTHLSTTSNCAAASHSFITRLSIAGECRLFSSAPSANIIITDRSFAYASFTCERRNRHRRRATHHWKVRLLPLLSKKFFAHIPSPELVHRRLGRLLLRTEELFNQSVFPSLCWNRCCSYHHNKQVKSEIKCDHSRPLKIDDNC